MSASDALYLQQIAFCQVAAAAALFYDYLLVLGSEVELIWARKWNLVTLLYAVVRYSSFFLIMDNMLYMGNFTWSVNVGFALYQIRVWGPYFFRVAMDIIMMKRIYVLSKTSNAFLNSPKWVLRTMVIAFIAKNAVSATFSLLAIGPGSHVKSIEDHFLGFHICGARFPTPTENFLVFAQFPTLAFETLLFVLAIAYLIADIREFLRSRRSGMWKVNDLMQILVRDNTVYFAIIVAAAALFMGNAFTSGSTVYVAISFALQNFLPYCFAPRLVVNMKEHENRVHMSGFGIELSDLVFNEAHFQNTAQIKDPA